MVFLLRVVIWTRVIVEGCKTDNEGEITGMSGRFHFGCRYTLNNIRMLFFLSKIGGMAQYSTISK